MKNITIIGGGNLGTAIASGLLSSGFVKPTNLVITKRNTETLAGFAAQGVQVMSDNNKAVENASIIILAVKPFQVKDILESTGFTAKQIVISAVTGVWLKDLRQWINEKTSLFRAMPNTAIGIRQSITCISHDTSDPKLVETVSSLFLKLGRVIIIEEKLMDAATVLGACGTAFAMRYMRASIQGGIQIGFSATQASYIVSQTVLGAAELLLTTGTHPEQEIDKVTTPRGCTIAGLNELEHQGFSSALIKGLVASYDKIV